LWMDSFAVGHRYLIHVCLQTHGMTGYRHETRVLVPGWDGLLYVYSILLIPTLFACLLSFNIAAWAKSRINYVFIFGKVALSPTPKLNLISVTELDVRTALNPHEYSELPLLFLATLMYAFWFSFARVASDAIDPTTWPMIWLLFVVVVIFNPLPILKRSARFWMLRNTYRLLTSGIHRVEVESVLDT
jgi:hypothetical protein